MERTKIDTISEQKIITAMVVSKEYLLQVASLINTDLLKSPPLRQIATWCLKYYTKYGEAPGSQIESIYHGWVRKGKASSEQMEAVSDVLENLSEQYEQHKTLNVQRYLDITTEYLNIKQIEALKDELDYSLTEGDMIAASSAIARYSAVTKETGSGIDPFNNEEAWELAYSESQKPLIDWHDEDANRFFGHSLCRDCLLGILGPEKRGKCIEGSTLIQLSDGRSLPISQIVNKKLDVKVLTYDEEISRFKETPILQHWDNGIKSCCKVTTRGGREIITTFNHKYLTPSGWKEIGDLKEKDYIAVPKKLDNFGSYYMKSTLVRFLAYMIAEGCCTQGHINKLKKDGTRRKNGLNASFTNINEDIIADFKRCCIDLGIGWKENDISYGLSGANDYIRGYGLAGHSAKTKLIPEEILKLPKGKVAEFLRVLYTCDGWCCNKNKNRQIGICLANRPLIYQIASLLTRFGLVYTIRKVINGKFTAWELIIGDDENIAKFIKEINFDTPKTQKEVDIIPGRSFLDKLPYEVGLKFYKEVKEEIRKDGKGFYEIFGQNKATSVKYQLNKKQPVMRKSFQNTKGTRAYEKYMNADILWDTIEKIEDVGEKHTYDLTIQTTHNYVAGNCLVHNTWWCVEFLFRALMNQRRVALFEVGDMSQSQILRRMGVRLSRRPMFKSNLGPIKVPLKMGRKGKKIRHKTKEVFCDKVATNKSRKKGMDKFMRANGIKKDVTYVKSSIHANSSINIAGIETILNQWEVFEGFVPDIIIIDYPDILDVEPGGSNLSERGTVNATWKAMRKLSQEKHCLVIAPTQADAGSYDLETLGMGNFTEDKRKIAHVTGMIGLNQIGEEKKAAVMRLNWIALREEEFIGDLCLNVGQCLSLGRAFCCSCL